MNALTQYLDLYREHRATIDAGSAPVINRRRDEAYAKLEMGELPRKGSEDYHFTDLPEILGEDYGINLARVPVDAGNTSPFRCGLPTLSTLVYMVTNDSFGGQVSVAGGKVAENEGITVKSLRQAAEENRELVEKYYGSIADLDNPLVALNTMLVQDGLFIHIGKNVNPDKVVQIVNITTGAFPLMSVRRVLIVAEENSSAQLLFCDHTQADGIKFVNLQTMEIIAKPGAHVEIYDLEESTRLTTRLNSVYVDQQSDSNVLVDNITLYNGNTRNEYFCDLKGEGADLHLLGMAIEDEQRKAETRLVVNHLVPHCTSNELFKYVVDDEAQGAFSGRIYVAGGAVKTEAYQSNRNIVGSDKARMFSKPQLEIYNDDVKCSHGSATGQLDEKQLFYMETRGIPEPVAKTLLKQAFMSDVIDKVRLMPLRDRLRALVERRFNSSDPGCTTCQAN